MSSSSAAPPRPPKLDISYTKFRIYRECGWKYKLVFVDGRQIPLNAKSSFGLSIHRALEAWLSGGDLSEDSLLEALRSKWLTLGYPDEAAEARWYQKAVRVLTRFYGEEESRRSRTVCVEKEFFWEAGAHRVRGKIDRIDQGPDGAYELVDYKTSPAAPTREQLEGDRQLRFYALGAKRGLGITPATLTVDSVVPGERVSLPYDGAGEEALEADIRAAASGIEAASFQPDIRYCPRCDFNKECSYSAVK